MASTAGPRTIVSLLLLAGLLIGIAQAALIPPFEGIDEAAHYSYIQQLAETGQWTRRGDTISMDIDDYMKAAPTGLDRKQPYERFFASSAAAIEAGRAAAHMTPSQSRAWRPGAILNWQAQHPPLYYLAMTPIYHLSKGWSVGGQIFLMRVVSYLLAWGTLTFAAFAALRARRADGPTSALPFALALWPAFFPMWFPEMARIGNDSLIIVFVSLVAFTMAALMSSASVTLYVLLAVLIGLGLLTKAILIPVAAAAIVVLLLEAYQVRNDATLLRRRLLGLAVFSVLTAAICGWWYLLKLVETGNLIGSHDVIQMQAAGGMIAGLVKHFQPFDLLRAPWGWIMTFVWGSTLSYVVPPRPMMIVLAAAAFALGFGCWRALRHRPLTSSIWLALLTPAFFLALLAYHTAVVISFDGGISPMWYMHAFAPVLAPLVAAGIAGLLTLRYGAGILAAVVGYPLAFLALGTAVNALYFAGCGAPLPGRVYFVFASARGCAGDLSAIYANLSVLSYPLVASVLFAAGWLVYAVGTALAVRQLARENSDAVRRATADIATAN